MNPRGGMVQLSAWERPGNTRGAWPSGCALIECPMQNLSSTDGRSPPHWGEFKAAKERAASPHGTAPVSCSNWRTHRSLACARTSRVQVLGCLMQMLISCARFQGSSSDPPMRHVRVPLACP
eukprot:scaffold74050_cov37-Tisochrysis_lutea.AAC.7